MPVHRFITFLTDFGLEDDFVGVCHGVMRRIAPEVDVIDVTHGIEPQGVKEGALALARAVPYLPEGVHLAVVDPGVGSDRRAVALGTADGRVYVGPDNGLLMLAADRSGIVEARELTDPRFHLERVSRTFHARDVFAPVAAHVASGVELAELGREIDPATLVRIELPEPQPAIGGLRATVVAVDRFGNLELNLRREDLTALRLEPGDRVELRFELEPYYAVFAETFADAPDGGLLLFEDSYGSVAVAIRDGDARQLTGARPGDRVGVAPVDS